MKQSYGWLSIFRIRRKSAVITVVLTGLALIFMRWNNTRHAPYKTQTFLRNQQVQSHVAFLKVHKAASTTIQNVILRYGWTKNLTFILPPKGPTISMRNSIIIGQNTLPPPTNKTFDISCCHVLYNRSAFEKALPVDTVYIGVVREPFSQFISNINYGHKAYMFNIKNTTGVGKPILEFLKRPKYYLSKRSLTVTQPISEFYNRMSYDFGFPSSLFHKSDEKTVQNYLEKLKNELDLVIVVEYIDHCMILMRRLLGWEVKDALYITLNKGHISDDTAFRAGDEEKLLYYRWSKLDVVLYKFFLEEFLELWKELSIHTDIQQELIFYRDTRGKITEFCKKALIEKDVILNIEKSTWSQAMLFTFDDCLLFLTGEMKFLDKLRIRQNPDKMFK